MYKRCPVCKQGLARGCNSPVPDGAGRVLCQHCNTPASDLVWYTWVKCVLVHELCVDKPFKKSDRLSLIMRLPKKHPFLPQRSCVNELLNMRDGLGKGKVCGNRINHLVHTYKQRVAGQAAWEPTGLYRLLKHNKMQERTVHTQTSNMRTQSHPWIFDF